MRPVVALAMLRYPASSLERATSFGFFELQETRLGPKNRQEPDVERLSSGSLAQSESEYTRSEKRVSLLAGCRSKQRLIVPLDSVGYVLQLSNEYPRVERGIDTLY